MEYSTSGPSSPQQTIVRNAFLAGALSASLLWSLASWTFQSRSSSKRTLSNSRNINLNDVNETEMDDEYGFMIGDEDSSNDNDTQNHAQHHYIPTSRNTPSPSSYYNPWSTEGSASASASANKSTPTPGQQNEQQYKQLHQQLLELRTSLVEHSRRTSLLLLDKILTKQGTRSRGGVSVGVNVDANGKIMGESLPMPKKRMRWPWESLRKKLNQAGETNETVPDHGPDGDANDPKRRGEIGIHPNGSGDDMDPEASVRTSSSDGNDVTKEICIGSIFGLDVGGTLSKLVYFEKKRDNDEESPLRRRNGNGMHGTDMLHQHRRTSTSAATFRNAFDDYEHEDPYSTPMDRNENSNHGLRASASSLSENCNFHESCSEHDLKSTHYPLHTVQPMDVPELKEIKKMKRSHSLFDLSSQKAKREEALHRFYEFANNLDTYDTEVKDKALSLYSRALGGEVHFIQFETRYLPRAMDLIRINDLHLNISKMGATGGGAHKYSDKWEQMLGIEIIKQDELDSLVAGMQFIMSDVVGECYTYIKVDDESKVGPTSTTKHKNENPDLKDEFAKNPLEMNAEMESNDIDYEKEELNQREERPTPKANDEKKNKSWSRKVKRDKVAKSDSYPYLLVMIGTGVSVIRVDGPRKHERISGSTIGGGTYWGLCKLLTDVEDFESVLNLAEKGDPSKVDMMVGDIYGKDSNALDKLGLTSDIVASSFGKLVAKQDPAAGLKQEDLARALLLMVTNNIGQVAYLNAQLHDTKNIYFVGNFLRHNSISQHRLSYAINYWSRGKMEALFLEHEGYFGALGAFLLHQGISADKDGKVAQSKEKSRRSREEKGFRKKRSASF